MRVMKMASRFSDPMLSSVREAMVQTVLGPSLSDLALKNVLERLERRLPENRLIQIASERAREGVLSTSPVRQLVRDAIRARAERGSVAAPQTDFAGKCAETMTEEQVDDALAGACDLMERHPEQMMTDRVDDELLTSVGVDPHNEKWRIIAIALISFFFFLAAAVGVAEGVPGAEEKVGAYEDHLGIAIAFTAAVIAFDRGRRKGWQE